jgi:hypothetical protein
MATFGSVTVNVRRVEHYYPAHFPESPFRKIQLLGTTDTTTLNQAVQQLGGRPRYEIRLSAQTTGVVAYSTLVARWLGATPSTWTGPYADKLTCIIYDMSPPEGWQANHVRFQMTLLEATT